MEDKMFDKLNDLNIEDTKLLLQKDIDLSMDSIARKRIEKSVMKKTGYHKKQSINKNKLNNIIGGIIMKKKIALALSAALFFTLAGGGYAYAKTPVAYVSVDINPSVELGVNAFDKVVSVEAYNEDGNHILKGADLLNTKVDEAVRTVVTNAINDGYIKEDGSSAIEITTSTDKEKVAAELDETLKQAVDETLTKNKAEAEVQTENVALARRDEARALGITPGKLNLIQKLQALDSSITVEEYKNSSVKDIQKKTKELRKNGIAEATAQGGTSTTTTTTEATETTTNMSETAATNNTTTKATTSNETATNEAALVETKNNKASNEKINNGNSKKEEVVVNKEQTSQPVVEKENKNENSSTQSSNNSSKEDTSGNIKTDSNSGNSSQKLGNSNKGNSTKSDSNGSSSSNSSNSGNGASSSQGKSKNK